VTFWIPGPIENPLNGSLSHAHSGHRFVYEQEISRGKDAKRGVEISVTALEETR
jgi:hypothetical protein